MVSMPSFEAVHHDAPARMKQTALFAFMVTHSGDMLLNNAMSSDQPAKTRHPATRQRRLDALVMVAGTDCRRASIGEVRAKCVMSSRAGPRAEKFQACVRGRREGWPQAACTAIPQGSQALP